MKSMDRYQVLLAEDDGGLRKLIADALTQAGLKVAQAPDGRQALKILTENPRSDALLISDVRMPQMDGYELATAAIALNPEVKILMLTGYPEMLVPPAALQAREVRILMKPVELDRLCDLALEMLARP
jgi:DNA-binding NtrC family response regulator